MKMWTLLFMFLGNFVFSQMNDDCDNAQVICANQPFNGTTVGATASVCLGCSDGASAAGNFCFSIENTVWFTFETNDIGGDANVDLSTIICDNSTGFSLSLDAVIIEAGTNCDESTYSVVSNCVANEPSNVNMVATGLLPNTTYYVMVDGGMSLGSVNSGNCGFTILLSGPAVEINMDAGDEVTIFVGENHTLSGSGPINSIWSPNVSLSSTVSSNPVVNPDFSTTYYYTSISSNGCIYQDNVEVNVIKDIFVTNTLTPNEDGINDFWVIGSIEEYPRAKVSVFDRWGQRVFNSVGYESEKRWDGTFSGSKLPAGTYFYTIDLNTKADEDVFAGYVTIIR